MEELTDSGPRLASQSRMVDEGVSEAANLANRPVTLGASGATFKRVEVVSLAWALWLVTVLTAAAFAGFGFATAFGSDALERAVGAIVTIAIVAFATVGMFITIRRASRSIGWILAGIGAMVALEALPAVITQNPHQPVAVWAAWVTNWSWTLPIYFLFLLLLLFPTGSPANSRLRIFVPVGSLAFSAFSAMHMVQKEQVSQGINNPVGVVNLSVLLQADGVCIAVCFLAALGSIVWRMRSARGVERQQLKWFAYPTVIGVPLLLVGIVSSAEALLLGAAVALAALPVCIGVAILRYRLYDIDLLISRTLVYLLLSASLTGLFIGQVVGFQALLRAVTGQQSGVAVAVSTLVIAALFNPLRIRIKWFIERTFYRRKYDAAQVLATFGAVCRDETDVDALRGMLVGVVRDTMQPNHVSIWLRER